MRRALSLLVLAVIATGRLVSGGPELPPELAEVPVAEYRAGDNPEMSYLLLGPRERDKEPEDGYGLVVILRSGPGPESDPEHAVLLRRMFLKGLPGRFLAAAPKPVRWTPEQPVVWPTTKISVPAQKFTTEEFVKAVVQDVKSKHKINPAHTFVLGWDESGPPAMAVALQRGRPVTGAFIAMSDFRASALPPLKAGEGAAFFFYHSPDDEVVSIRQATMAKLLLEQQGAKTELKAYEGGHGWPEPFTSDMRNGIRWLQAAAVPPAGTDGAAVAGGPPADADTALLYDSFEKGRVVPDGWRQSDQREFAGEFVWDKTEAAVGDASLSLKGKSPLVSSVGRWLRHLDLRKESRGLGVYVQARAKGVVYARLLVESRSGGGARLSSVSPVELGTLRGRSRPVNHGWQQYKGRVTVPRGATHVTLVFELYGPGQVWFDELLIED